MERAEFTDRTLDCDVRLSEPATEVWEVFAPEVWNFNFRTTGSRKGLQLRVLLSKFGVS